MDSNQMLVLALANVPTFITVLIGILMNNGRLNDVNSRLGSIENRMNQFDNRFTSLENKFDTRFDIILSKIEELDIRLTRIEERFR